MVRGCHTSFAANASPLLQPFLPRSCAHTRAGLTAEDCIDIAAAEDAANDAAPVGTVAKKLTKEEVEALLKRKKEERAAKEKEDKRLNELKVWAGLGHALVQSRSRHRSTDIRVQCVQQVQ